jgi:glyoxylase-like metal-dependent hydrolase (beta-lactamase superfamily II)/rhodanese-related sulfurtransferase
MKIEQIYTGCLAQGTYYIVSGNEAAIIDPLREIQPYIEKAKKDGVTIKYIFETHFHADFVSGHIDLAKATGAQIVYGPTAKPSFEAYIAKDNEEFKLGDVSFKVLHTPGHTMESSCFLVRDENGKDNALFSGDTLFIGDVGRPDLAQKAADMTQEDLATLLYDSLRNKVMTLNDEVIVYPAHGAGSACGKNMSDETVSTIGMQKNTNYALRANMTKEEFVKEVTDGLLPPPSYFPENVRMNKEGYTSITEVLKKGLQSLSTAAFEVAANETGALVLDTRNPEHFVKGFIPNSINIGIDGSFAPWVGALIPDIQQNILLVCEPGREEEVVTRLARVGYDNVLGYLNGGFAAWKADGKEVDTIDSISAFEYAHRSTLQPLEVIDVRRKGEYDTQHVLNTKNAPLEQINENMAQFPAEKTFYLHCAGGYRSVIAASILKARGFNNIVNIEGGFDAINETEVPVSECVCSVN